MAAALVEAGAHVVIAGRQRRRAEEVAVRLGPAAIGLELDVRLEASVQSGIKEVYERLGGLRTPSGWRWEYGAVRAFNVPSCDAEMRALASEERVAAVVAFMESVWP